MRSVRASLLAACVTLTALSSLVVTSGASGQRRPRPSRLPACQQGMEEAVRALGPTLGACFSQTNDFRRGDARIRLVLSNRGQIVTLTSQGQVNGVDNEPARQCIERTVRAAHFPACPGAPLVNIERNWTFQATTTTPPR